MNVTFSALGHIQFWVEGKESSVAMVLCPRRCSKGGNDIGIEMLFPRKRRWGVFFRPHYRVGKRGRRGRSCGAALETPSVLPKRLAFFILNSSDQCYPNRSPVECRFWTIIHILWMPSLGSFLHNTLTIWFRNNAPSVGKALSTYCWGMLFHSIQSSWLCTNELGAASTTSE